MFFGDDIEKAPLTAVNGTTVTREPVVNGGVIKSNKFAVGGPRQQETGLFEQFSQASHVVGEAAIGQVKPARGIHVTETGHEQLAVGRGVEFVNTAAGKDVSPANEVTVEVALEHENFKASRTVSDQHHRGCGTGNERDGHADNRTQL